MTLDLINISCHRVAQMHKAFVNVSLGLRRYVADAFFTGSCLRNQKTEVHMRIMKSFRNLSGLERGMWSGSVIVLVTAFIWSRNQDYLTLAASLVGVTALIFVSKGDVLGQVLTVAFSLLYAVISWRFRYYGEMITYLGMTAPIAILSVITWIRNPYSEQEVKVHHLSGKAWGILWAAAIFATGCFYFILKAFDTPNLFFSTVSIATSFLASSLMMLRSPYYAIAYGANDIVLIILWILAAMYDMIYLPMILCFAAFLVNDLYGFFNWNRMKRRQQEELEKTAEE